MADADLARFDEWRRLHEKTCDERAIAIKADTTEIKGAINVLSNDVRDAVKRIHERIDDESKRTPTLLIKVLIGGLGLCVTIIGYLLLYGPPWSNVGVN